MLEQKIKYTILITILFFTNFVIAQTNQIDWLSSPVSIEQKSTLFHKDCIFKEGSSIPYMSHKEYNKDPNSFKLVVLKTTLLNSTERDYYTNMSLPNNFVLSVQSGYEKGKLVNFATFNTIRQTSKGIEKVITYQIESQNMPVKNKRKQAGNYATNSIFSSGTWYKIGVSQTGLYKIDYNFIKNSLGINPSDIDPRTIKIVGSGFGMLPQSLTQQRPDDPEEIAIKAFGENDGIFNESDYFLFYAIGPITWDLNSSNNLFDHTKHIYDDQTYYFISFGGTNGLRIQTQADLGSGAQTYDYFDDYYVYESDEVNLIESGREWYGNKLQGSNNLFSQNIDISNINPAGEISIVVDALANASSITSYNVIANGTMLGSKSINRSNKFEYDNIAYKGEFSDSRSAAFLTNQTNLTLNISYNNNGNSSNTFYLNYLKILFQRKIKLTNNFTQFRNIKSTDFSTASYKLESYNNSQEVWDVTDPIAPKIQTVNSTGIFSVNSTELNEFIIYSGSSFPNPTFIKKINNQNLHGIANSLIPDLIIIVHPDFKSEATRLANFKKSFQNIDVIVVTPEEIYNEFSSGAQDITAIRNFCKLFYDKSTVNDSLKYLLLFGDCSYDYKNRISVNQNFVPVYESYESLAPLKSFSSDDYYGFLDDSEGSWNETPSEAHLLDIGIGRLPVTTASEATSIVDKIIYYSSDRNTLGKWRNKVTLVADDGDFNSHLNDAETLSKIIEENYPNYNIQKLYLDAYRQESSASGEICEELNNKIEESANRGTLILNYSGHGGETGLAQENILSVNSINSNWDNMNNLPFLVTATCSFGKYDNPGIISGAESAINKNNGGAIGIITSTRVVYQSTNLILNSDIYRYIFTPLNDGTMPCLGDVIRQTKNRNVTGTGVNNRNYALLGDPSLRLAYPRYTVKLTKVKGNEITVIPDTLKALGKILLEGEIYDNNGNISSDYNGILNITVYDKQSIVNTFGTQNSPVRSFKVSNNFLFDGSATISNGKWKVEFVVPKDISYNFDKGKISFYAIHQSKYLDAAGADTTIIIGGTDPNAEEDNSPPIIQIFMNDRSFVFGGLTNKNPLLIADFEDDNGINIAGSGVGHEITATIDNNTPIVLNEYYSAELDNYKKGSLSYKISKLENGRHVLVLKAFDTHNNSSIEKTEFIVANEERIALSHVLNYPNPFSSHTEFHFDHNRPGDNFEVMVQIFTVSGKLIKTLETTAFNANAHFNDLTWDGRDDFGDKIGRGVYVYKVKIKSLTDQSYTSKFEKLVLLY